VWEATRPRPPLRPTTKVGPRVRGSPSRRDRPAARSVSRAVDAKPGCPVGLTSDRRTGIDLPSDRISDVISVRKFETDGQAITAVYGRVRRFARDVRRLAGQCIRTIAYSARFAGRGVRVSSTSWVAVRATVRAQRGATIEIGRGCEIHPYAMILSYGGSIRIGDLVSVNPFTIIYGIGDVTIGSGVRIATSVTVIPANHVAHRDGTPPCGVGGDEIGDRHRGQRLGWRGSADFGWRHNRKGRGDRCGQRCYAGCATGRQGRGGPGAAVARGF